MSNANQQMLSNMQIPQMQVPQVQLQMQMPQSQSNSVQQTSTPISMPARNIRGGVYGARNYVPPQEA